MGADPDPDGYTVRARSTCWIPTASCPNSALTMPTSAGEYSVQLGGVAETAVSRDPSPSSDGPERRVSGVAFDVRVRRGHADRVRERRHRNDEIYTIKSNGSGVTRLRAMGPRDAEPRVTDGSRNRIRPSATVRRDLRDERRRLSPVRLTTLWRGFAPAGLPTAPRSRSSAGRRTPRST